MAKSSTCKILRPLAGFSLLEMSIVLVIIGLVTGAGAVMFAGSLQKAQADDTNAKLALIQKALLDYRRTFNRIPCPADITLGQNSSANFGIEGATPGTCTGGTPAANYSSGNFVEGMVPTKTLKLPDDVAFDGWGRRMVYAVDIRATAINAFTTIAITDTTARFTVKNTATAQSTYALYVLLSAGSNGHGAFPRNGGSTRVNTGSTNSDELQNCDCSNVGVYTAFDTNFVQKLPSEDSTDITNSFDDMLVFATRAQLRSFTE